MDNGACSYRRFLDGDDKGLVELVGEYKDGLILFLNGYVDNISVAEELTEDVDEKSGLYTVCKQRRQVHRKSAVDKRKLFAAAVKRDDAEELEVRKLQIQRNGGDLRRYYDHQKNDSEEHVSSLELKSCETITGDRAGQYLKYRRDHVEVNGVDDRVVLSREAAENVEFHYGCGLLEVVEREGLRDPNY